MRRKRGESGLLSDFYGEIFCKTRPREKEVLHKAREPSLERKKGRKELFFTRREKKKESSCCESLEAKDST